LYEILTTSATLRPLIRTESDVARLRDQAVREGMLPLQISGAKKICSGITTLEEVFRVAGSSDQMQ